MSEPIVRLCEPPDGIRIDSYGLWFASSTDSLEWEEKQSPRGSWMLRNRYNQGIVRGFVSSDPSDELAAAMMRDDDSLEDFEWAPAWWCLWIEKPSEGFVPVDKIGGLPLRRYYKPRR